MTPCISREMARFRQLAVEAEKRIKENKQRLRSASSGKKDQEPLPAVSNPLQSVDAAPIYSPPDVISAPPSVASTYLAKYMQAESDISSCSMDVNYATSSRSNTSTTLIDNQDEGNTQAECFAQDRNIGLDNEESGPDIVSPSNRVRKLSYTLDQPSPILMAHFKHLKVTETDTDSVAANDQEPAAEDAQSLGSSQLSEIEIDSTSGTYCTAAGTSSQSEISAIRINRNEHLQRYLQQVQCLNSEVKSIGEWMVSDGPNQRFRNDYENRMLSTVENPDTDYIYENMLLEQEKQFEKLRLEMEEQHKIQLDQLKQQQDEELKKMLTHVIPKNQQKLHNIGGSMSAMPLTLSMHQDDGEQPPEPFESNLALPRPVHWHQHSRIPRTIVKNAGKVSITMDLDLNKRKFDKVSAAVKGYLVRRLFRTEKVQTIIKTIKDTLEFAIQFHSETPIKQGCITPEDATLNERILAQLSSACFEFHDIFITLPIKERMSIIAQDRALLQEKLLQEKNDSAIKSLGSKVDKPRITSATQKALERRRHRAAENKSFSTSPRITHLRGRLHSPRSISPRVSPKDYHKLLTSAIDSGQARAKSPVLSRARVHRTDTSMSENMDKLHLRSVRRCLYGKHQPGKPRSRSTIPIKLLSTTKKS